MNHASKVPKSAAPPGPLRRILRWVPWRRLLIIGATGLLSYLLVPLILVRYNDSKSLREARLARAIRFGDFNTDFESKANGIYTLMGFFDRHNQRMKNAELKEVKYDFFKNYKDRYMADINTTAWWWPEDFSREVATLRVLSDGETVQLSALTDQYKNSLVDTAKALDSLWVFMDSPDYKATDESLEKLNALAQEMNDQRQSRAHLVEKISALFLNSNHKTRWQDTVRFW